MHLARRIIIINVIFTQSRDANFIVGDTITKSNYVPPDGATNDLFRAPDMHS